MFSNIQNDIDIEDRFIFDVVIHSNGNYTRFFTVVELKYSHSSVETKDEEEEDMDVSR